MLWVDLDGQDYSIDGVLKAFHRRDEWDAVFANGVEFDTVTYYDKYALRMPPQEGLFSLGPEHLGEYWWRKTLSERLVFSSDTDTLFPVLSAFAGMGLYRKQLFVDRNYSCIVTEEMEKYYSMHWSAITAAMPRDALPLLNDSVSTWLYSGAIIGGKSSSRIKDLFWKINSGYLGNVLVCEHVTMHISMALEGKRMFIYSPMKFYWGSRINSTSS